MSTEPAGSSGSLPNRPLTVAGTVACLLLFLAACQPFVLAANGVPTATAPHQLLALGLWGAAVLWIGLQFAHQPAPQMAPGSRVPAKVLGANLGVAMTIAAAATSAMNTQLPGSLLCPSIGTLIAAWVVGAMAHRLHTHHAKPTGAAAALCAGLTTAGLLTATAALVQVFAPTLADGRLIASAPGGGRAFGNLRQPNQMGSLILWAMAAAVTLREMVGAVSGAAARSRGSQSQNRAEGFTQCPSPTLWFVARAGLLKWLGPWAVITGTGLGALALVLSGSRTGAAGTLILAAWGVVDKRLTCGSRAALIASPVLYVLAWGGMHAWSGFSGTEFGAARVWTQTQDVTSGRIDIWANALQLILAHPWSGVGWGNFNFAWTLTPFPARPKEFYDHAHNLPIHLAVELGVPLALFVMAALARAVWLAWRRSIRAEPVASSAGRGFVVMLLIIGLHSLLEYPLWYAYFLLPTAFMLGFTLGVPETTPDRTTTVAAQAVAVDGPPAGSAQPARHQRNGMQMLRWPDRLLTLAGLLCLGAAVHAALDLKRVSVIFSASEATTPLEWRIAVGQRSPWYAHHARYAAATTKVNPSSTLVSFETASRHLLDARLMMGWATEFAQRGEAERARHIAQRLTEFDHPEARAFLAPCQSQLNQGSYVASHNSDNSEAGPPSRDPPFQCERAPTGLLWRDFLPGGR